MALKLFTRKPVRTQPAPKHSTPGIHRGPGEYEPAGKLQLDEHPLQRQMQQGRLGHLIASQQAHKDRLGIKEFIKQAHEAVDNKFAMVPDGFASLAQTMNDAPGSAEVDINTKAYLLARHCVTNAEFQQFVDDDGYETMELWPQTVWPHLIDFKDQTEQAGPRYWREGRYDRPLANHPVVGICYYEAAAYARWAGFRLPSEPEWQMAASWRIRSAAQVLRRYPWGDALDTHRCNIWASNIGHTVPVDDYEDGMSPNGVKQLTGNVWEWTTDDFNMHDDDNNPIVGDMLMKAIRGGAFDTYFPAQATSVFRTGAGCIARTHNIGFRLAADLG